MGRVAVGLLCVILLIGCRPEEPTQEVPVVHVPQRVLLELYTNARGTDCIDMRPVVDKLVKTYGDTLVVVALHMGSVGATDMHSQAGDDYFAWFGLEVTPMGVINRQQHQGSLSISSVGWNDVIRRHVRSIANISLGMEVNYSLDSRAFDIKCSIMGLREGLQFTLWLVEDNVVTTTDGKRHAHRKVLRRALNGTWGEGLKDAALGMVHKKYWLPEQYDARNCSIVAFVSEASTRQVIQVVQTPFL